MSIQIGGVWGSFSGQLHCFILDLSGSTWAFLLFIPLTSTVLEFGWHQWHQLGLCYLSP